MHISIFGLQIKARRRPGPPLVTLHTLRDHLEQFTQSGEQAG